MFYGDACSLELSQGNGFSISIHLLLSMDGLWRLAVQEDYIVI